MSAFELPNRAFLQVQGPDALPFLNRLLTNTTPQQPNTIHFAALLTPQGKVLSDMFVFAREASSYILDLPASRAQDILKRLQMYKLRADVTISVLENYKSYWSLSPINEASLPDPRHANMGYRTLFSEPASNHSLQLEVYTSARISCCVPEGEIDFSYTDIFAHEINLDLLHGVDFKKGCYVGQEVVSRVHHRGSDRKRFIQLQVLSGEPTLGEEVRLQGQRIGILGSYSPSLGLALAQVRLDKLSDYPDETLTTENATLKQSQPYV